MTKFNKSKTVCVSFVLFFEKTLIQSIYVIQYYAYVEINS